MLREATHKGPAGEVTEGLPTELMSVPSVSPVPIDHSDLVADLLKELSNHNERVEERKGALLELLKITREDSLGVWEEHFKTILLLLLETLGDKDVGIGLAQPLSEPGHGVFPAQGWLSFSSWIVLAIYIKDSSSCAQGYTPVIPTLEEAQGGGDHKLKDSLGNLGELCVNIKEKEGMLWGCSSVVEPWI